MAPIVYRCGGCGYVLHVFERVGPRYGPPTPSEVIARYGGRCPRCGRRLRKPGIGDVEVYAGARTRPRGRGGRRRMVSVRVPEELARELEKIAVGEGRSVGELVREAVALYLASSLA